MVFPIAALFGLIKVACVVCGGAFCVHKVTKAVNKAQKYKDKKLEYSHEEKMAAQERNKQIDTEKKDIENKVKPNENKIQELEKKAEDETKKSKDPNLSEEEKTFHKRKAREYLDEVDNLKQENQGYYNKLKDLDKQKEKNDRIINSTGTFKDKYWIWEFLTLENILIMLAIYALYNIVRDERRH